MIFLEANRVFCRVNGVFLIFWRVSIVFLIFERANRVFMDYLNFDDFLKGQ